MNGKIPSVTGNVSEFFQMPVDLLEQMSYSRSYLFDHIEGTMLGVSFHAHALRMGENVIIVS